MNRELQIKLAQKIWDDVEGETTTCFIYYQNDFKPEENMAIQDLIKKSVVKRSDNSLFVNSQTKFFLENNGKTEREIKEEEEKKIKEQELELSKEANAISKKSMKISRAALIVSFISICIAIFGTGK